MNERDKLAALARVRAFLLHLARTGTTDDYFAAVPGMDPVQGWYAAVGLRTPETRALGARVVSRGCTIGCADTVGVVEDESHNL